MTNGLSIDEKQFKSLPQKEQLLLLYQNQCETIKLIRGYKLYYRLTTVFGGFLSVAISTTFLMLIRHLGGV